MSVTEVILYHVRYEMRRPVTYSSAGGIIAVDSTIVELGSDTGLPGWGEVCPLDAPTSPRSSALPQVWADRTIDGLKLKISRVGVLYQAHKMTDFCAESGIGVWVQEAVGGAIAQAMAGHLAVSIDPQVLCGARLISRITTLKPSRRATSMEHGHLVVLGTPGLGIRPDRERFSPPVARYG